ncbi:putative F-box/LRR-repeat protein At3g18150 [Ziziphus jujuba]|uniref:F-box/LRR-repeat protein At3g18150 n=1 Tax=Ziziphus jujuba TaxID=326968 RepID=A0ABM3ZZL6_ZIZJJ|nr:putative F-box/LRR-repeat protein At3g18150 [Ziziphus jujuba]
MDLISELPEHILHHVLYFLAARDVAKASILSKTWRSIALSCPYVDLRTEHYFESTEISFKQYVETTLQNCITKNLGLRAIKLRIFYYEPEEWDDLINRWINFVARTSSRLEKFDIDLGRTKNAPYNLPEGIVFSFKTLIELSLCGFGLDSSSKYCHINLPLLQSLILCDMDVNDTFVLNFMFSCPLLEKLIIKECEKLTSVNVSSLQRIKMILIQYCGKLTRVEVRALSLQCFSFHGTKSMPCEIDLAGCHNLKFLSLHTLCKMASLAWVQNQISKLVGLEILILDCLNLESIKISNSKLKQLEIERCRNLGIMATEFDALSLHSVKFLYNKLPFYSINTSNLRKATFEFRLGDHNDTMWFYKLKELYEKTIHIGDLKVAIQSLKSKTWSVITFDELSERVLIILEELKELNPHVTISSMSSADWLLFLFSKQRWTNMYVASSSHNNDIMRVFYDEVFNKKTGEICRLNRLTERCSRYYNLDGVEIERIEWIEERDKIIPLLKPHQTAFYNVMSVKLKWQKKEEIKDHS